jgi:hypothetical protein
MDSWICKTSICHWVFIQIAQDLLHNLRHRHLLVDGVLVRTAQQLKYLCIPSGDWVYLHIVSRKHLKINLIDL